MVSLEQVRLLETKVTRAIDYVKKVTAENTQLKEKLDSYQNRIEELEVLIQRFKEDQNRIEDSILSALDRLNQFEDALESVLSPETTLSGGSAVASAESKVAVQAAPLAEADASDAHEEEPAPLGDEKEETDPLSDNSGELDIF